MAKPKRRFAQFPMTVAQKEKILGLLSGGGHGVIIQPANNDFLAVTITEREGRIINSALAGKKVVG